MPENTESNNTGTDQTGVDPADRDEVTAPLAADYRATGPAPRTVPPPPAPYDGPALAATAPPNNGAAVPEPPGGGQAGPPIDRPVDGLALWDSESEGHAPAGLNTVRVDGSEALLVPFTVMMVRVILHYVSFGAISGYARCNGPHCLLCRIGRQQEVRDLLAVYNLLNKAVEVLAISPNVRPHALRPQIGPLLRRLAGGEGPLLISVRSDRNEFTVAALPVPVGADDGAAAIAAFQEGMRAGLIDLASAYQALTDEEWAAVDEVRRFMTAKGVTL